MQKQKKQNIKNLILSAFSKTTNLKEFIIFLKYQSLHICQDSASIGVVDATGKKYFLHTLGLKETLQNTFKDWETNSKILQLKIKLHQNT